MQVAFPACAAPPVAARSVPRQEPGVRDSFEHGCSEERWVGRHLQDARALTQLLIAGKLYQMGAREAAKLAETHPPLYGAPTVTLARPLMIVPGWTTRPEKFSALVEHLTRDGANGGRAYFLRGGQAYQDPACSQRLDSIPADARVFVSVFEDPLQPPDQTAPQLQENLKRIGQGPASVDLMGYSMGGIAARVALDQGCDAMARVVLLGTPNRGTRFAHLASYVIQRDIGWAMRMAGLSIADLPAMEWMAVGSPHLEKLNATWDRQQSRADILTLGADGLITPTDSRFWPMGKGDGLVEARNLRPPSGKVSLVHGEGYKHHGNQPNDTQIFIEMARFFDWERTS